MSQDGHVHDSAAPPPGPRRARRERGAGPPRPPRERTAQGAPLPPGTPVAPAHEPPRSALARLLLALLPLALLSLAAWTLHRELAAFHLRDIQRAVLALPPGRVLLALGLTAANYALLTGYDVLALRYAGERLRYPRVALTSFIAYAFGHNVGLSTLSGGSVRYRLYSSWGLSALVITRVVGFCALTFWVGFATTGALAFLAAPVDAPALSPAAFRVAGGVLGALVLAYLLLCARVRRPLTLRGAELRLPTLRLALVQVALASADWVLGALVFSVLLPPGAGPGLLGLLALFLAAQLTGVVSQVPGGLGVFESVVLAALSPRLGAPGVLGLLVVYRIVYYLVPFVAASLLLAGQEALRRRQGLARLARGAQASFAPVVPTLAAVGSFVAGAVLLFSGATPTVEARLHALERLLPLPVVELSHFFGSLVGLALLLLARGLQRRLGAAYALALALLGLGAALSLAKGLDWEEATLLGLLLLALLPFRDQFYRQSSLVAERFGAGWAVALALVVGASGWLGFFAYRHVDYSGELWWQFAFQGDAPRFLRASVGVLAAALLFGVAHLLRPARAEPRLPDAAQLARARPLVQRSPESMSHLALVGDKALLFDAGEGEARAFLMYAVEGRAWVALGDPVGPLACATELAWRFRELVDRHHGHCCFYQVGPGALPRYLDLGLSLLKLGEEAVVPLGGFSLEGPQRRALRHGQRTALKEGLCFELVPAAGVPALLPQLQAISDAWLARHRAREKGFSLGYFDPRYLAEGPVALVRRAGADGILGFANVWTSEAREELSVDLMRYRPDAPRSVMELLFVSLMQWGAAEGYRHFNLGMAPFSGLETRALAPLWHRLGALLFQYGEHFYNFQGLRRYKEKFDPEWRPRYLAAPGGLALPGVLTSIAALVSRGLGGVVTR